MIDNKKILEAAASYEGDYTKEALFVAGAEWYANHLWHGTEEMPDLRYDNRLVITYINSIGGLHVTDCEVISKKIGQWRSAVVFYDVEKWAYKKDFGL